MKLTATIALLAAALFVPLFVIRGICGLDFFWWMALNLAVLLGLSAWLDPLFRAEVASLFDLARLRRALLWGLGSAVALYAIFWVGGRLSTAWFSFARPGIEAVYGFKEGASLLRIALLLGLIIGPGEELFWRGFLQRRLEAAHGPGRGLILGVSCYAAVHLGSGNLMLVLAALTCGFFWGWIYQRTQSLLLVVISHTAWDLLVFLAFPLTC